MSDQLSNFERQMLILQFVEQARKVSVGEICIHFGVSEATARRDLEKLAVQGKLHRVHGGAVALRYAPPEAPILQRKAEQRAEKQRIGKAVASLINAGETIFLGSGTTVMEAACALRDHPNLTVITNSLPVLNTLSGAPGITLVAVGGMFRSSELSFIGHIAEQSLAELRADKVIIGVHAISLEHGLTNDYLPETMTDRAILRCGRQVIVAADHTKFDCVATAFLAPLSSIHILVTDLDAPADFLEALRGKGIEIIQA